MQTRRDTTALLELLEKKHISKPSLAREIGITPQNFSNKIHGKYRFNVTEAYTLCKLLGIPLKDMLKFFE